MLNENFLLSKLPGLTSKIRIKFKCLDGYSKASDEFSKLKRANV